MKKMIFLLCFFMFVGDLQAESFTTMVPISQGLRLRTSPALSAAVLDHLVLWEKLTVLEKKDSLEKAGEKWGHWVKVRRARGQTGWCFDAFLKEIDPQNFIPFISFNHRTQKVITFYNDYQSPETLTMEWNGKALEKFQNPLYSPVSQSLVFYWDDPDSMREMEEGLIERQRYLFVYSFITRECRLVDSRLLSESDYSSPYWKNRQDEFFEGGTPDHFVINTSLRMYTLDGTGTVLVYNSGVNQAKEWNMGQDRTRLFKFTGNFDNPVFMGPFLYFSLEEIRFGLYDPTRERFIREDYIENHGQDGVYEAPRGIHRGRFLFVSRGIGFNGEDKIQVIDLKTKSVLGPRSTPPKPTTANGTILQDGDRVIAIQRDFPRGFSQEEVVTYFEFSDQLEKVQKAQFTLEAPEERVSQSFSFRPYHDGLLALQRLAFPRQNQGSDGSQGNEEKVYGMVLSADGEMKKYCLSDHEVSYFIDYQPMD